MTEPITTPKQVTEMRIITPDGVRSWRRTEDALFVGGGTTAIAPEEVPDRYQTLYEVCSAQRHEEEQMYAALREKYQVLSVEHEILLGERNEARRQLTLVREHYRGLLASERKAARRKYERDTNPMTLRDRMALEALWTSLAARPLCAGE